MIGIYKITSPSGKVYIGQSWDIYDRWKKHKQKNLNRRELNS
jgi:predicted GIY-YIG superfamily endonuclease